MATIRAVLALCRSACTLGVHVFLVGTADAEKLSLLLTFESCQRFSPLNLHDVVGQNVASHASPSPRNCAFSMYTALVHTASF